MARSCFEDEDQETHDKDGQILGRWILDERLYQHLCETFFINLMRECMTHFNISAATIGFRQAFPVIDGSTVRSIPFCTVSRVLDGAITTNFGVKKEDDIRRADDNLIQKMLMFAALGLLANEASGGDTWAKVVYNPATEATEYVPGATATRQLFADVIVVLTVLALGRVWLHTRLIVETPVVKLEKKP